MQPPHTQTDPDSRCAASESADSAPAPARRSALNRLVELFGSQTALAAAIGRAQPTVSGWEKRGVPMSASIEIVAAAEARGLALRLSDLAAWILEDRGHRPDDAGRRAAGRREAA